jgi:3-phosphoshikimate 1-carboxyvinyltransferase
LIIQPGSYQESSFTVEPDWSAASYWYEIVALCPGSQVLLRNLSLRSLQGDVVLAGIFRHLGVGSYETGEGMLLVHESEPEPHFHFDFKDCPDLVPAVAASCVALNIDAQLKGLKNLIIKESNRLQALKNELEKINPNISIVDGHALHIGRWQGKPLQHLHFSTYDDHRMAMALAPLSVCCAGLSIENPDVVAKSYPGFWDHLSQAGFRFANL